jgi:hypothetical protein
MLVSRAGSKGLCARSQTRGWTRDSACALNRVACREHTSLPWCQSRPDRTVEDDSNATLPVAANTRAQVDILSIFTKFATGAPDCPQNGWLVLNAERRQGVKAAQRTQMQNLVQAGGGICTALDLFFKKFGVYPSDLNDVRLLEFTPNNEAFDQLAKNLGFQCFLYKLTSTGTPGIQSGWNFSLCRSSMTA